MHASFNPLPSGQIAASEMRWSPDSPLFFLVLLLFFVVAQQIEGDPYINEWAVRIRGGKENADRLAKDLGYINRGQIANFVDTYLMEKEDHPQRSKRHAHHLTKRLTDDVRVEWAEQQFTKERDKRDNFIIRQQEDLFNDPLWTHEWYLTDTRSSSLRSTLPKLDLNVQQCWKAGFTGEGVVVTVLDDGLEWNHTDIRRNYDPYASTDLNGEDDDPSPNYDEANSNRHGTRCAGEIAMIADNNKCGVGVAYNSKIGGIRMLDGGITDIIEARAISFNLSHIWVVSASWGPTDDGRTVEGPGRLAAEAFKIGTEQGRNGKGVVYVWAAGNGGSKDDNCNCDGYTGSIFTLSIGSASQHGKFPWYGEKCASTLACTYSSGAYTDQKICSTDLRNECTIDHTGTSAAAPLAAGIVAIVLQANPNLTWRDVQHLVVWTSEYDTLRNNPGWATNDAGLTFNSRFGFGLINCGEMLTAALNWTLVPPKSICHVSSSEKLPIKLTTRNDVTVTFNSDNCEGTEHEVNYLEHVEVTVDIEYKRRGALEILIESPKGTKTNLLFTRAKDYSTKGFRNWTFMSVHTWGEDPRGMWKVTVQDHSHSKNEGVLNAASLILHGTKEMPQHMVTGKRVYRTVNRKRLNRIEDDEEEENDEIELMGINDKRSDLTWTDLIGKKLNRRGESSLEDEEDFLNQQEFSPYLDSSW